MNLDKEFWYSAYQPNADLTAEIVQKAEELLGVKLPASYINLLNTQNGGETQGLVCPTTVKTSWADNHVSVEELFGIDLLDGAEETEERDTSEFNILDSIRFTQEWSLPENQIVLCGDRNGCITIDYRQEGKEPIVTWLDMEMKEDIQLAENFAAFLNKLVPFEKFKG